jgi:hypothetical protein
MAWRDAGHHNAWEMLSEPGDTGTLSSSASITKKAHFDIQKEGSESLQAPQDSGPGWRFRAAFGCLCLVNLVCALDATSMAVAIPVC